MPHFGNNPMLKDENGETLVRRFVHSPLTIEHSGINAKITENGKVVFTKVSKTFDDGTVEYDEVEIPASLIFRMGDLLRATRQEKFLKLSDVNSANASNKVSSPAVAKDS